MPALPPVPGVLRLVEHSTLQDDLHVFNKYYVAYTGSPPSTGDCNAIAIAAHNGWNVNLNPMIGAAAVAQDCTVTDLSSSSGNVGFLASPHPGTRSGAPLSAAACAVVNKILGRRYRGGKPKCFIYAGIDTDLLTVGTWKSAFTTAMESAWNGLIAAVLATTGLGITLTGEVNVSFYEGFLSVQNPVTHRWRNIPQLRVGGPHVDPITGVAINALIGSQRRRNQ